jgi:hypothetical protein
MTLDVRKAAFACGIVMLWWTAAGAADATCSRLSGASTVTEAAAQGRHEQVNLIATQRQPQHGREGA